MNIFHKLSNEDKSIILQSSSYHKFDAGTKVFSEGDTGDAMYTIVEGEVEIYRGEGDSVQSIIHLPAGEVFGELGMLARIERTASARTTKPSVLFEMPSDAMELLQMIRGPEAGIQLCKNLIAVLGDRLRSRNVDRGAAQREGLRQQLIRNNANVQKTIDETVDEIKSQLSTSLSEHFDRDRVLAPGEFLIREYEKADGFYFIHEGELEVLKEIEGQDQQISKIIGPASAGELGYFANDFRSAGLRTLTDVKYSFFSGEDFEALCKTKPTEALKVIFAAARLIVCMIVKD